MKKVKQTVNELPEGISMSQVKVKTPDGTEGWWVSQWDKGVWLRKEKGETRIHPIFVNDLRECLTWEVVEIEK